jgi:hypothetical protein
MNKISATIGKIIVTNITGGQANSKILLTNVVEFIFTPHAKNQ